MLHIIFDQKKILEDKRVFLRALQMAKSQTNCANIEQILETNLYLGNKLDYEKIKDEKSQTIPRYWQPKD